MSTEPPRRLRLLITRPSLAQGGADRVTAILLERLSRDRFELSLALNRVEGPFADEIPEDVQVHELGARSLWTAWLPLSRLLRETRPDVVFASCGGMSLPASIASLLTPGSRRLVLSERNVLVRDHSRAKRWALMLAKRLLYPRAFRITAVSRGVRDDLVSKLGLDPRKIQVTYNPVYSPRLTELARADAPHPWLSEDAPVVLAAGRLVPAKGFDLLLRAVARVGRQRDLRLLILGDGPERARLLEQADRLGIGADMALPGFDKNPFAYMRRCALFVLPSRFEGLPGVLIQAMACGAPVIAADCHAGPAEIIRHGQDGLLVPVNDVGALAEAMIRLLDDPGMRRQLGERAARSARRFDYDSAVHAYERALL